MAQRTASTEAVLAFKVTPFRMFKTDNILFLATGLLSPTVTIDYILPLKSSPGTQNIITYYRFFFSDELEEFEKRLKVVQQPRIEDYLMKQQDENFTVKDFDELYVDLRIHNKKDNYNRLETRIHYDLLELQKDVDRCHPIKVNDLFLPKQEGASTPRRVLVIGKAGIGKTMLTMPILDKWVNGHLMPTYRHVFFALWDLSHISQSSLTDLFTQDKIFDYISKFCRGAEDLQTSIEDYISGNTNIVSLCYVPMQCGFVCQTKKNYPSEQFPGTVTQLYTMTVTILVNEHHPLFKVTEVEDNVSVVHQLRGPLLGHAELTRDGMGESPVKVTFSKTDIDTLHLENAATECGLLTFTKEKRKRDVRNYSCAYHFMHLTIQELLGAVSLVSSQMNAESMIMKLANDGQLHLVLMFVCGLVDDQMNKEFLDSLGCSIPMTTERVLELVVQNSGPQCQTM